MAYGVGQVQQAKILSPQEHLANALKLRADQLEIDTRTQEAASKLRAESEKAQDDAWLQTAAKTYRHEDGSPDWVSIGKAAQQYKPMFGLALTDRIANGQKQEAETVKLKAANERADFEDDLDKLKRITDPFSFSIWSKRIKDPDLLNAIGPEWTADTPQKLEPIIASGLSQTDWLKNQERLAGEYGKNPEAAFLNDVSLARNDADLANAYAALRSHVSADVASHYQQMFGTTLTPEVKALAAQHTQTAEQRAVHEERATTEDRLSQHPANQPNVGSFEDYVTRTYGPNPTSAQVLAARKAYGQADDRPAQSASGNAAGERLSPDAIDRAGAAFRLLGKDSIPTRLDDVERTRIMNAAAAQSKTLGVTPVEGVQKQLAVKGDAAALTLLNKLSSTAEASEIKASSQAAIINDLSKKVSRTSMPLINGYLLAGKKEIQGDSNTTQLFNALTTFTAEYAKIIEGSTGSVAGASDSARRATERIANASMNQKTLSDVIALMQKEMQFAIQGYDVAKQHVQERIATPGIGSPASVGGKRDSLGIR